MAREMVGDVRSGYISSSPSPTPHRCLPATIGIVVVDEVESGDWGIGGKALHYRAP
jgi:hypothetical protein